MPLTNLVHDGVPAPQLICLLGAECSGKTTLAKALAAHFSGLWVPEYLRAFCDSQGRTPQAEEQVSIMRAQCAHEEQAQARARQTGRPYVFCDGAPLLTAIYSDFYFADASLFAFAHAWHARYALTLFLQPDMPWVPDGLQRDGAPVRAAIHARLRHELDAMRYPRIDVAGAGTSRLQAAILAVQTRTR